MDSGHRVPFVLRWFPYGALDSHPVFPSQSASGGRCLLGPRAGACCCGGGALPVLRLQGPWLVLRASSCIGFLPGPWVAWYGLLGLSLLQDVPEALGWVAMDLGHRLSSHFLLLRHRLCVRPPLGHFLRQTCVDRTADCADRGGRGEDWGAREGRSSVDLHPQPPPPPPQPPPPQPPPPPLLLRAPWARPRKGRAFTRWREWAIRPVRCRHGSSRMAVHRRRRGGGVPPPFPPDQSDHRKKNEIYNIIGPFLVHKLLGPRPSLPPSPPSKTSLAVGLRRQAVGWVIVAVQSAHPDPRCGLGIVGWSLLLSPLCMWMLSIGLPTMTSCTARVSNPREAAAVEEGLQAACRSSTFVPPLPPVLNTVPSHCKCCTPSMGNTW